MLDIPSAAASLIGPTVDSATCSGIAAGALAALAGVAPSNPRWFDWSQLPAQVLLLQAWGVPGGQGWNAPTWTLSALIACYLLLPWICRAPASTASRNAAQVP